MKARRRSNCRAFFVKVADVWAGGMFGRRNGGLNDKFVAEGPAMRFRIAFRETVPHLGRNAIIREVRIP